MYYFPRCYQLDLPLSELKTVLEESSDNIIEFLKVISQENRLKILKHLIDGPKKFSSLLVSIGISKTALANHLKVLTDTGLIEKLDRGRYHIKPDAIKFIQSIIYIYKESETGKALEREKALRREHLRFYKEDKQKMEEYILDKKPIYQPAWISYLSAVTGVLNYLGLDCDIYDVGGRTGYAFIVHVSRGTTCPSGPTAMADQTWIDIHRATGNAFGYEFNVWSDNRSFPSQEGDLSEEDLLRAKKFFNKVKEIIKTKKTPAIIWGIPIPEYGIVYGIKGDSYIVSTFRSIHDPKSDSPIKFTDLQAPGCLDLLYFGKKKPLDIYKEDKESLERAITLAQGGKGIERENYIAGPEAYTEWARVLKNGNIDDMNLHGNSYVAECYHEGKTIAKEYLKRLAERYPSTPYKEFMIKASTSFTEAEKQLGEFCKLFPFGKFKEIILTADNRALGAKILLTAKKHEEDAIDYMKQALKLWNETT